MQYTIDGNAATLTLAEGERFLSERPNEDGTRTIRVRLYENRIIELQRGFEHILRIYDHEGWEICWRPERGGSAFRWPTLDYVFANRPEGSGIAEFRRTLMEEYPVESA